MAVDAQDLSGAASGGAPDEVPRGAAEVALELALGHTFASPELLRQALTHRSLAEGRRGSGRPAGHSERLEFLGDAVLGTVTAQWLYETLPASPEGHLAKLKAYLVSEPVLAAWARTLGLGAHLRLGVGEDRSGGRDKPSLLADALEAVFGALLLDGGFVSSRRAIVPMLEAHRGDLDRIIGGEPKTELQEEAQRRGWPLPVYRVAAEEGPEHVKVFRVECWLLGEIAGEGAERSKKRAEQHAAAAALRAVRDGRFPVPA